MRLISVRNAVNLAVNFCKKCGEARRIFFTAFTVITAFLTKIHSIQRISSSAFNAKKINQKPRAGMSIFTMEWKKKSGKNVWNLYDLY